MIKLKEMPPKGAIKINNSNSDKIPIIINYLAKHNREKVSDTRNGPWAYLAWNNWCAWWCKATTGMKIYDSYDIIKYIEENDELTKDDLIHNEIYVHKIQDDFAIGEVKKPSSEEKEWFLQCEGANKFISFEDSKYKLTEFKANHIYKHNNGNIVRWNKDSYIGTNDTNERVYKTNDGKWRQDLNDYKLASKDEIDWLEACERANRFIPFSDRNLSVNKSINKSISKFKYEDFVNTRVYVKTKQESERLQKLIFELGFEWHDGKKISYTTDQFIYIYDKITKIRRDDNPNHFKKHENKEIFYDEVFYNKRETFPLTFAESYQATVPSDNKIKLYIKPQLKVVERITKSKIILKQVKTIKL